MTIPTIHSPTQVDRSAAARGRQLSELVSLIKEDIRQAREAAERAGMPYYRAAGEKLLEAKAQLTHGEWGPWLKRNFSLSDATARLYMRLARESEENEKAFTFSSLGDFLRKTRDDPDYGTQASRRPEWQE